MHWQITNRADRRAAWIADKHYSRQSHGSRQFTPPGRVLVLVTPEYDALWCTSWPYPEFVNRDYKDAWNCSLFRNESSTLESVLIREAVAVTRWKYGTPPVSGMITMIDAAKVRHKRDPGRCYLKAGFHRVGMTQGGLIILQLRPVDMPEPAMPNGATLPLFEEATA
jgi:hypothetical protein